MPKLTVAAATLLVAVCGLAHPSAAQPSPAPPPPPAVAPPSVEPAPAPPAAAPPAAAPAGQPPGTFGPPHQYQAPAPAPPRDGAPLNEVTALLLSLGGTMLSWPMMLGAAESGRWEIALVGTAGTYLAPSFGHWYRGQILTRGLGVRTVGAGLFVLGGMKMFDDCGGEDCVNRTWALVALGGFLSYVVGSVDDIVTAPLEVREHNKRFEVVGVGPMATQGGTGLSLVGRF